MGQTGKKLTGFWITLAIAVFMVIAIAALYMKGSNTNRIYQAEAAVTPAPTIAPPALYARPTEALLRNGSIGPEVSLLQGKLKELGFYTGEVDGHFGDGTKASLVLFQLQHQLEPDGMAGAQTLEMLYSQSARALTLTPQPALPASGGDLPLLVNRKQALDTSFVPQSLVFLKDVVPQDLVILKDPNVRASKPAVDALVNMLQAAVASGLGDWQVSEGYRTVARQQELFDEQVQTYITKEQMSAQGAQTAAEKTVARPGTSEHHTGLAFDLTVPNRFFGDTQQAQWLEEHCWEYGFIMRYTANKEDITGYLPEPWHVRYVGEPHAVFMRDNNLALEEYLALYD